MPPAEKRKRQQHTPVSPAKRPAQKPKRQSKQSRDLLVGLAVGHAELQGQRSTMEDALVAQSPWNMTRKQLGKHLPGSAHLLGVFDGHGGRAAADFTSETLPVEVQRSLEAGLPPSAALVTAHMSTEVAFFRATGGEATDGTTAVCALICGRTARCFVSNLGDSRAFVVKRPSVVKRKPAKSRALTSLTTDMDAENKAELRRIKAAGGTVDDDGCTWISQELEELHVCLRTHHGFMVHLRKFRF